MDKAVQILEEFFESTMTAEIYVLQALPDALGLNPHQDKTSGIITTPVQEKREKRNLKGKKKLRA